MHTRTGARPRGVSMLMMLMMSMLVASIALAADITGK
jgi:hypothetical protein